MKNYSQDPLRQYHIQVAPGEVGRYVLLPGDPGRCEEIASRFDSPKLVACNREFKTYTGYVNGTKVSVCSTGIGGPSAVIALKELVECGADTFIRVGTCGGMQLDVMSGDVVIGNAAIRAEGTSREIAPIEYPAVSDFEVTSALVAAASKSSHATHCGVVQCKDHFYGQHEPESQAVSDELSSKWQAWKAMGCLASEMESAAIYIYAQLLGVRAGGCYSVVANQEREAKGLDNPVVHDTSYAIDIAVDAICSLISADRDQESEPDIVSEYVADVDPKALIFDFDGTIAFTEDIARGVFDDILASYGSVPLTDEQWASLISNPDPFIWSKIKHMPDHKEHLEGISIEDLCADRSRRFIEATSGSLSPNEWFSNLSIPVGAPCYVVTNNSADTVRAVLDGLGIAHMFSEVISCGDEDISKAEAWQIVSPDADPSEKIIFEDDPSSLIRAKRAGFKTVAVENRYNREAITEIKDAGAVDLVINEKNPQED